MADAPNPLKQFLALLKEAKVPVDAKDLEPFDTVDTPSPNPVSYFLNGFPCPEIAGIGAYPFAPGTAVDFYYYPGDYVTTHTVSVIDTTVDPPTLRWTDGVVPASSPWPFKVTIPAQVTIGGVLQDVFQANKTYMIGVYPTAGGFPIGCPRWMWVPMSMSIPTMLLATAFQASGSFIRTYTRPPAAKK